MLFEIIIALFLGIIAGTITGLIPGIHINLIGAFLVSLSIGILAKINPIYLTVFIVAMAITHTFVDFIPSVFMGCPDTDTELSVLPGHELLKQGLGYQAVVLTCYGSLSAVIILTIISIPISKIMEISYPYILAILPFLLIAISILLVSIEKNKFQALQIFLLTGFLGLIILNMDSVNQPLLPLLSGLFGSSMILTSIKSNPPIPLQIITKPKINLKKPLLGSLFASPFCSFLPGLGSGQAAVIGNIIANTNKKGFLVLVGSTNTLVMGFSFISLYIISRTRTGAAVAIQEILGTFTEPILILMILTSLIAGIFAFFITLKLAETFAKKLPNINYVKLSKIILIILTLTIFFISGFKGILIFIISTLTGLYCISKKIKRTNMMGCLLIPTIIFYLTNM